MEKIKNKNGVQIEVLAFKEPNSNIFYCHDCFDKEKKASRDWIIQFAKYGKLYRCSICKTQFTGIKDIVKILKENI